MSQISIPQLAAAAGISARHLQRLLSADPVPGVARRPSGRWTVDNPREALAWAGKFQRWQGKPVKARSPRVLPAAKDVVLEPVEGLHSAVVAATRAAAAARDAVLVADAAARRAGHALIQAAATHRGSRWTAYLAENGIAPEDARRLMSRARAETMDHRALIQMGIVDVRGADRQSRTGNDNKAGRWIRATSEIFSWWRDETKQRPLREWTIEERDAVRMMLKPIADIARQLGD